MSAPGLLLDTHAWLWLGDGTNARMRRGALQAIERAGKEHRVFVSPITVWEIGMLVARKRISLAVTVDEWLEQSFAPERLQLLALDAHTALESTCLPGVVHGDPADRLLIAAARVHGLRLVTADRKILAYGAAGHVDTLAP
ncbi:ribonuclease VapC22 [mine drainage metagenome]|uniref:Ribonuclease VapC22 n=1 Tax=mine drainage metagenome TaxID=410659 RepID=A0A1J5QN57_9ZZZZ